jgi:hypothetical protein
MEHQGPKVPIVIGPSGHGTSLAYLLTARSFHGSIQAAPLPEAQIHCMIFGELFDRIAIFNAAGAKPPITARDISPSAIYLEDEKRVREPVPAIRRGCIEHGAATDSELLLWAARRRLEFRPTSRMVHSCLVQCLRATVPTLEWHV